MCNLEIIKGNLASSAAIREYTQRERERDREAAGVNRKR